MDPDHHDLIHEFPQYREQIHALKTSNAHFARMFEEYHAATREVERLEVGGIPVADESFEDLKKRRLKLKDGLYAMLTA